MKNNLILVHKQPSLQLSKTSLVLPQYFQCNNAVWKTIQTALDLFFQFTLQRTIPLLFSASDKMTPEFLLFLYA